MKTRQITQIYVYYLVLNPITDRLESKLLVALSIDKDELIEWYNEQKADKVYSDDAFYKIFKPGSKLEWLNPIDSFEELSTCGHGIYGEWISEEEYNSTNVQNILI